MLIKKTERQARRGTLAGLASQSSGVDRRAFLRRSGLAAGGLATLGALPLTTVRKADAAAVGPLTAGATIRKSVCTHCSVGCTVLAEVANGVWVGQEPAWESPINRGSHCAKGASVRELVSGERRLKYPMKLVNGQWTRIKWEQAINEIGDKLIEIRGKSGADSVYWLGSAKMTNEGSYLFRKFGAFWGTNNTDHQARICHSTTVTGVANTWGYGAMTNSYTDIRNSKTQIIMGGNPAEAHPVSLQHLIEGAELQKGERHRHRSAPDAHGGACHRICPPASGHRHPGAVRDDVAHHQERLGRQGFHQAARLRLRRRAQGNGKVDAGGGRTRVRRSRRAAQACRPDVRDAKAVHADLVHGPDPAHGRHRQRAGELHAVAAHRQCRRPRHGRQHLPRPRQRAGRHRRRPRYRDAAVLLRPGRRRLEALVARLGGRLQLSGRPLRRTEDDGTRPASR